MNLFSYSPTWGEINYFAFGVASVEFHIELFGLLQKELKQRLSINPNTINAVDDWLNSQTGVIKTDQGHQHTYKGHTDKTMTVYIRNLLDHPDQEPSIDQPAPPPPTAIEIRDSIVSMLNIIRDLQTRPIQSTTT